VHHLDTFAVPGIDGLIFPNEHGQPFLRGNFNKAVPWSEIRKQLGVPCLHLHDLRHMGNTLVAQLGESLRDLMVRMGHDAPAAALIYQHRCAAADESIAAALDTQLNGRQRMDHSGSQKAAGSVWACGGGTDAADSCKLG
jgi:integrase